MQYRRLTPQEYIESSYVNSLSFFFPMNRENIESRIAEGEEPNKNWIGAFEDDGELIACFCVNPFDLWFDGHLVGMGGIGGVATLLEHRRKGAIRGIFNLALREMYDNGTVFSALYPFSYEYYRMFGYDVGMTSSAIKGKMAPLLKFPMAPKVCRFSPEDTLVGTPSNPDDIFKIYNQWAPKYNMAIDRDGMRWRRRLEKEPTKTNHRAYINYNAEGEPVSYLLFKRNDAADLEVLDTAWVDKQGLYYILGLLGRMDGNLHNLVWTLPDGITPELVYKYGNLYQLEHVKRQFSGMNRIINAQKALELMRRPLVKGSATIAVSDAQIAENNATFRVTADGKGGGEVTRLKTKKADLLCDIQGLTRLVTGFEELNSAQWEPNITINGNEEFLKALFPKKLICMNEYF